MTNALVIDPADTVATVLADIEPGTEVDPDGGTTIVATERIPRGHKVALVDLAPGAAIVKYGQRIGVASRAIPAGGHVHTQNLTGQEI